MCIGTANTVARSRSVAARMPAKFMDALGATSSDDDDDDDDEGEEKTTKGATARRAAVSMEALARHGFRGATMPTARDGEPTATAWSRGRAGDGAARAYGGEESARTRRAGGEGLAETCARAIESARANERARDDARRERDDANAKARARTAEAKRAIREDDARRRTRAREEGDATRERRRARIDVDAGTTATTATATDDEARLVESGGFDFGDE
jgi:hypothetical protein